MRLSLLLTLFVVVGCAADDAGTSGSSAAGLPDAPLALRGEVVGLRAGGAALRVDHEAVPSLGMEAMAMDLALADPSLAAGLAPGDKVALTIEAAPRLRITAIERLPADTPLTLAPDSAAAEPTTTSTPATDPAAAP